MMFIPLYNEDEVEVQIWRRGRNFEGVISGLCSRYNPLVGTPVEIERHGKKGDMHTTYQPYPRQADGVTLDDLPPIPDPIGTVVLDKNFNELTEYVAKGCFDDSTKASEIRKPEAVTPASQRAVVPPRRKF